MFSKRQSQEASQTHHKVTVTDISYQQLTGGKITKEELMNFSFKFLLEREPNTSILSKFNITIISQYFPEYQAELFKILG